MWTIFESLQLICYNFASVVCFLVFLATMHVGSLLPDQQSNLHPLHRTPGKSLDFT